MRRRSGAPPPATNRRAETPSALVRRMHWQIFQPLATLLGGDARSLVRGAGVELSEVRPYQPGDDIRHIDWSITARTDEPFVRESYVERALDVWLLLDQSASINWGTAQYLKRDHAEAFALAASQLFGQHGHRVGALPFDVQPRRVIPPAAGRNHQARLLAQLRQPTPAAQASTDLAAALRHAEIVIRRRSLLLLVSDFLVPDGWQPALARLSQRHELIAVRLHDPREVSLPDVGILTLEDPETGEQLTLDTSSRSLRERYAQAAQAQSEQIAAVFRRYGIEYLLLDTNDELLPTLTRFLQQRRQRRPTRH